MKPTQRVFLSLGSNQGDSPGNIQRALKMIEKFVSLKATSFLYQTKPMYFEDQPNFYNAACEIETELEPRELLDKVKAIERAMGRSAGIRYGPRTVDIDIITFGARQLSNEDNRLTIPHPKVAERRFVLQPCCDIDPSGYVPTLGKTFRQLLDQLKEEEPFPRVTRTGPHRTIEWKGQPLSMGILNATPDSFSDGGQLGTKSEIERKIEQFYDAGCDIVDVGGQSTRPNADVVTTEEELDRVIPVIETAKAKYPNLLLSVDTFRADVAKQAVEKGADIINDVSGGTFDDSMFSTASDLGLPLVIMHRRGDSHSMDHCTDYTAYPGGVSEGVGRELQTRISVAMRKGVPRWQIIADPGLGFAKTSNQSLDLMLNIDQLKKYLGGLPILVGPSRKRFVAALTGRPNSIANDRDWATSAAIGAAVTAGADLLRFHHPGLCDTVRASYAIRARSLLSVK